MSQTAEAYRLHTKLQSPLVVIIIISIVTSVKSKELIMKGVRRQRHTGCMTMMMMAKFLLLANVLSNAPAACERKVGGVAG